MKKIILDLNLTKEQKDIIDFLFIKMMEKYEAKSNNENQYFLGVMDGINHCYKVIHGIEDDYLDEINLKS